jgi:hypothetical protein
MLLTAVAAALSGCGEANRARVSGTLQRADGQPLVGARVIARSTDASVSASGYSDSQGQFELTTAEPGDGVPPGEYQLAVIEDRGDRDNRQPPTIAAKYRDQSTSGLRVSAATGEEVRTELRLDPP